MSLIYWVVNVVPGVSFGLSAAAQGAPLVVLAGSGTAIEPTNEFMITVLDAVTSRRGLYIDDPWPAPLVDHESFNGWLPLLKTYILSGPNPPANVRTGMLGMTSVATPNGVPIETFAPPAMSSSFSAAGGVNLTVLYGADMPPIGLGITIRTTGALPTPGVAALLYYVIINDPVARTFQVSLALNGAPVNWTAPGTGRHFTSVDGGWGVDQDKYRGLNGTPPRLPGDLVRGLFDGGLSAAETYSAWTPALALYRFSGRLGGDTVRALVNSGLDQAEAFLTVVASVWTAQIIATSALDLLCAVPPSIGAGVVLSVDAGGTLPAPYVVSTTYFCTARGAGSCQLAATRGGAAIAHTTLGSGTLRMAADPVWAWAG